MNPLDEMTWEERFWAAFNTIIELERDVALLRVTEAQRVADAVRFNYLKMLIETAQNAPLPRASEKGSE